TIKQFGAKGDGSTDDYAALRGAAAFMSQPEQAGKTLYFPAGDYKINQVINRNDIQNPQEADLLNIRYVNAKDIKIIGCNAVVDVKGDFKKQKRLFISGNVWRSDLQQISPFDFLNSSGFTLAGFEIKGNVNQMDRDHSVDITEDGGRGVSTSGSTDYILEDLHIDGFSTDGMLLGIGYQYKLDTNVTVRNVISEGNGRQGLSIQQMRRATFTNDQFLNTGHTGKYGVHSPGAGVDIEPLYCISGCPDINNRAKQGLPNNTGDIVFDHCTFSNNIGAQIVAGNNHGTENVSVQNSEIDAIDAGSLGAVVIIVKDGVIKDSTIHTNKTAIIATASDASLAIQHNTIIDDRTSLRTAIMPLLDLSAGAITFSTNKVVIAAASYSSANTMIANLRGVTESSHNLFQTSLNQVGAYFRVAYGANTKVTTDTFTPSTFVKPNSLNIFPNPYSQ
ncbi:MAG TPA: glycosyl hydrolase family 28-related protein, partial [Candidatus Andersenbacteria bacterium]|nr:glycosyl hydrolase family 28-related protein [Candidatus Andersenbacteria bacterium]